MVRCLFRYLKPLCLAVLLLVLAPCVAEFVLRLRTCREQFSDGKPDASLRLIPSWQSYHELEPLLRLTLPDDNPGAGSSVASDRSTPRQPTSAEGAPQSAAATHEFRTNSFGLRGPEISVAKSPGLFRIVCLGDERVLGSEVEESETFCRLLEQRLQTHSVLRVEVINAGVPGYCPLLSYLQMRHRLMGLSPDLIVAHFDMTDVWDDRRIRRLTDMAEDERPLVCVNPALSSTPGTRPLTENFLVWGYLQNSLTSLLGQPPAEQELMADDPRHQYAWLTEDSGEWSLHSQLALSAWDYLSILCEGRTNLMLATHPAPWQISGTASADARIPAGNGVYAGLQFDSNRPFEIVREFARTRGLPLCDVTPLMRADASPDVLFLNQSPGFSPRGHQLYADQLATAILQTMPGPWNSGPSGRASDPLRNTPITRPGSVDPESPVPLAIRPALRTNGVAPLPDRR